MKRLAIGLALSLACSSFVANAADVCSNLPGKWTGHGRVVFDLPSVGKNIKCIYSGVSNVTSNDADAHTFTSEITLSLLSGACPATETLSLPGTCDAGNITMIAEDGSANLNGKLNQNGKVGTLAGEVVFEIDGKAVKGRLEKTILKKAN